LLETAGGAAQVGCRTVRDIENFNTYAAFISRLRAELHHKVLVTGVTALGQYTKTTYTFAATSITVLLKNQGRLNPRRLLR